MRRIMITAMGSGSGKTVLTGALLRSFALRGLNPEGFKCGPDYIDPTFHRLVLGVPSHNLDPFLQGERALRRTLAGAGGGIGVIEGAMGWFDGKAGTASGSAWEIAAREKIPAVLCIRPHGAGVTLAAMIRGICSYKEPDMVRGLFLTDCRQTQYEYLKPILERECSLPVTGYLPHMPEAVFDSRHLGLVRADEIPDARERFDTIAAMIEKTADLDLILSLAEKETSSFAISEEIPEAGEDICTIAVARDEAFCFYYQESLEALERAGAKLVFFSPLRDSALPAAHGLYLGGGYPELYAEALSGNHEMIRQIRDAVTAGIPTVAECGGFLYLQGGLEDAEGRRWPMAGVLPGQGFAAGKLVRFGYCSLTGSEDSLLFRKGEAVPAHEFHHWESTDCGNSLTAYGSRGGERMCAFTSPALYAGFPHLHLGGELPLAQRFVQASAAFGKKAYR